MFKQKNCHISMFGGHWLRFWPIWTKPRPWLFQSLSASKTFTRGTLNSTTNISTCLEETWRGQGQEHRGWAAVPNLPPSGAAGYSA